jgi:hypothetical protein
LGRLQEEPEQALDNFVAAQAIYTEIGDQYSQGCNLLWFIVPAQTQLSDLDGVLHSLEQATAIADAIDFEPFRQRVEQIRAEIENSPNPSGGSTEHS